MQSIKTVLCPALFYFLAMGGMQAQKLPEHQQGFAINLNFGNISNMLFFQGTGVFQSGFPFDLGLNGGYVHYWNFSRKAAIRTGGHIRYLRETLSFTDGSHRSNILLRIPAELHWRVSRVIAFEFGPGINFMLYDQDNLPPTPYLFERPIIPSSTSFLSLDVHLGMRFQLVDGLSLGLGFTQGVTPVYKNNNTLQRHTRQSIVFGIRNMWGER